jgi:hypothetical protein
MSQRLTTTERLTAAARLLRRALDIYDGVEDGPAVDAALEDVMTEARKLFVDDACTSCGTKTAYTEDWTLWPWPDGAWLCSRCNDERHERERSDER